MKMILSICCCLSLGIEITQAQAAQGTGQAVQPLVACPDSGALSDQWRQGGRERVMYFLTDEMKISILNDSDHFPDIPFEQPNPYIDSNGNLMCEYRSSQPFIRINMGRPKMEKIEK